MLALILSLLLLICAMFGCCFTKTGLRIVGGKEAKIERYPWLAQVTLQEKPHCGGVIVSHRVVITAAHCFLIEEKLLRPNEFSVLVGSSISLKGTKYKACKIYIHPYYGKNKYESYDYDIAMMLISTKMKFDKHVQIARLAPDGYWHKPGTIMTVAGYGCRSSYMPSKTLRKTYMRYVDRKVCNSETTDDGKAMPVPDHMFCLIGSNNNSDCFGDSGSAVMWKSYVVGIVCTGREKLCGSSVYPSMYTDLHYFRIWINISVTKLETRTIGICEKTGRYNHQIKNKYFRMLRDYDLQGQSDQLPLRRCQQHVNCQPKISPRSINIYGPQRHTNRQRQRNRLR